VIDPSYLDSRPLSLSRCDMAVGVAEVGHLTGGSNKRQQPYRLQAPAITWNRPFGLRR
jgi:hypothetical protein